MRSAWLGNNIPYETALALQEQLVYAKLTNPLYGLAEPEDTLLLLEHDPIYTLGTRPKAEQYEMCLRGKKDEFLKFVRAERISIIQTGRGGLMTYHGPGQLIGYFIKRLPEKPDIRKYIETLASGVMLALAEHGDGIRSQFRDGGVWVDGKKICSIGIRVKRGIAYHGFALNVTDEPLAYMRKIYPCGMHDHEDITSLSEYVNCPCEMAKTARAVAQAIAVMFRENNYETAPEELGFYLDRKPRWIRVPAPKGKVFDETERLVDDANLSTVCKEAACPNIGECWSRGDVTIMILGNICTRSCGFCNVATGRPPPLDWNEPHRTAQAVAKIPHSHVVITSVDRDEQSDGGAKIWATTIRMAKQNCPQKTFEALTPDFKGNGKHVRLVLDAGPHVFAHNIETVKRLHGKVRPQAKYRRSLRVLQLARVHPSRPFVKSNIMLGHGESEGEVIETIRDLKKFGVEILMITQYLRPTRKHRPVIKFYSDEEFRLLKKKAEELGIPVVIAGPLVRTSYKAGDAYKAACAYRETRLTAHAI